MQRELIFFLLFGKNLNDWLNNYFNQDAPPTQSIQGKLNSNSELPCEGQSSGDKSLQSEYLNKKGKILECDVQESGFQENMGLKKNGSITEATTSTSDKEIVTSKNRTPVKVRQTYSGPLMHGAVLSHSISERGRPSERFIIMVYYLICLTMSSYDNGTSGCIMLSSFCKSSVFLGQKCCSFIITLHKLVPVHPPVVEPN